MKLKLRYGWMYLAAVLMYLAISDLFGLVDLNSVFASGGELYDIVFLVMVTWWCLNRATSGKKRWTKEGKKVECAFLVLLVYIAISGVSLILSQRQGTFQTISVMREVAYILIFFCFRDGKYHTDDMIKLFIGMELLAEIIYLIEAFNGPLTALHVQGLWETVGLYRSHGAAPLFSFFMCPMLIFRSYQKDYLYSRRKDMLILVLLILFSLVKLSRLGIFLMAACCIFSTVNASVRDMRKYLNRLLQVTVILVGAIGVMVLFYPDLWDRIWSGIIAIINIGNVNYSSTLSVRTSTMAVRWQYLQNAGKLLFGLGPMHNDTSIQLSASIYERANAGIIASDTAYGTLLIRYGIAGIGVYILPFLVTAFTYFKKKDTFSKSIAIYSVMVLVSGGNSHAALCFYAFIQLGILLGIVEKKRLQENLNMKFPAV